MDRPKGESPGATRVAGGTRFRVWAPAAQRVEVLLAGAGGSEPAHVLEPEGGDWHGAFVADVGAGARYRYRLDGDAAYPDPCSRFQPDGPHGASMVVDPHAYAWQDGDWLGLAMRGQVIYEMHVGAFTAEGTFDAAIRELPALADLGVTCLELMPVGEFPGRWNWGYDGVSLFAPFHGYGDPDAMRRFVDAAHACGLGVILDVVWNHFGSDGAYHAAFSRDWFTDRYDNEWGDALNFDGLHAAAVREMITSNACMWIREFHLDGLRIDATQSIHDASRPHILAEVAREARAAAAPRQIILVGENEPQRIEQVHPPEAGGFGLDALWNDDFHHAARVALTGSRQGYFHDYCGSASEFVATAKRGYLFQGQYYHWQKKPRGTTVTDEPAWAFVAYLQNHDQVGNTLDGMRIAQLAAGGRLRAMTAFFLLAPHTPMLFMGQEFAASGRFAFFADHEPRLATKVFAGRRDFLKQFKTYATDEAQAAILDPASDEAFCGSKLDHAERTKHAATWHLHRDLLAVRRDDPVISRQDRFALDGAVLREHAFLLRWFDPVEGDRLLIVNLGEELELHPAPEPLLAPPAGGHWKSILSTDVHRYGGLGAVSPCIGAGWHISGECATLLAAVPNAVSGADGEASTEATTA